MSEQQEANLGRVSISIHPSSVQTIEGYEEQEQFLAPVVTVFKTAYDGLQRVHDAAEAAKQNPAWNEEARILHVNEAGERVMAGIAKQIDSVRATLGSQIKFLDAELSKPLAMDAERPAIAAEIRAHAKSLPMSERFTFLNLAHESGDNVTLRAVLGAPGYLSGINEEERQQRTRRHHEKTQPVTFKRLRAAQDALRLIDDRTPLVWRELVKAVGAPPMKVHAIKTANQRATAAIKAAV